MPYSYPLFAELVFNLRDLWTALLSLAGIALMITVIVFVARLIGTLTRVNRLVEEITPSVKETVDKLPATMENVSIISGNVVDLTDDLTTQIPEIVDDVTDITDTAKTVVAGLGGTVNEASDLLTGVIQFFHRGGRNQSTAAVVGDVLRQARRVTKTVKKHVHRR